MYFLRGRQIDLHFGPYRILNSSQSAFVSGDRLDFLPGNGSKQDLSSGVSFILDKFFMLKKVSGCRLAAFEQTPDGEEGEPKAGDNNYIVKRPSSWPQLRFRGVWGSWITRRKILSASVAKIFSKGLFAIGHAVEF